MAAGTPAGAAAAPSPIGWRLDLLLGGLAAVLVGATVVLCLHSWLLADDERLLPAPPPGARPAGVQDDAACDVVAAECDAAAGGVRLRLLLLGAPPPDGGDGGGGQPQQASHELVLPLPPSAPPCSGGGAAAALALRDAFHLELGGGARCVLSSDGAGRLSVQIEAAIPAGSVALLKFAAACALTCTPCCVAVGFALALAAHPQAAGLAVLVEEKTRQSGLLPRCDFDARTLGGGGAVGPGYDGQLGKLV